MLAAGAALRIPTVADEWLAVSLAKKVPPGTILPNRFFDRAAQAIYATMQT
jgi:type III secretion protein U